MLSSVCRVCLVGNLKMWETEDNRLLDTYETFTNIKLKPLTLCYICHSLLRRCCRFTEMARRSEQILMDQLNSVSDDVTSPGLDQKQNIVELSVAVLQLVTIIGNVSDDSVLAVKQETTNVNIEPTATRRDNFADNSSGVSNLLGSVSHDGSEVVVKTEGPSSEDEHFTEESATHVEPAKTLSETIAEYDTIHNDLNKTTTPTSDSQDIRQTTWNFYLCNGCGKQYKKKKDLIAHLNQTHKQKNIIHKRTQNKKIVQRNSLVNKMSQALAKHFKNIRRKSHACTECNKSFPRMYNLKRHLETHNGEKPFSCKHCHKSFSAKYTLSRHIIETHIKDKLYICDYCNTSFYVKKAFVNHIGNHSEGNIKKNECQICNKKFGRKDTLLYHLRTHTGEKPFACAYCDKKYIRKYRLKAHMIVHTRETHVCEYCSKSFHETDKLQKHMMRTHIEPKPYKCEQCDKRFKRKNAFETHLRSHTGEKLYECKECGKKFSQHYNMVYHSRIHTKENLYSCDQCDKKFGFKYSFMRHQKSHIKDNVTLLFECEHCQKRFSHEDLLLKHIKKRTQQYACELCDERFCRKSEFLNHQRRHYVDKPYSCEQCDKSFSSANCLLIHTRIHSGLNPNECVHCNKQFSKKFHLIRHMQIHSGEKPYTCKECDKQFAQKFHLERHINIHLGVKPYICDHCDKSFHQKAELLRHLVTHSCK